MTLLWRLETHIWTNFDKSFQEGCANRNGETAPREAGRHASSLDPLAMPSARVQTWPPLIGSLYPPPRLSAAVEGWLQLARGREGNAKRRPQAQPHRHPSTIKNHGATPKSIEAARRTVSSTSVRPAHAAAGECPPPAP